METLSGQQPGADLGQEVLEVGGVEAGLGGVNHQNAGSSPLLIKGSRQLANAQVFGLDGQCLELTTGMSTVARGRR